MLYHLLNENKYPSIYKLMYLLILNTYASYLNKREIRKRTQYPLTHSTKINSESEGRNTLLSLHVSSWVMGSEIDDVQISLTN